MEEEDLPNEVVVIMEEEEEAADEMLNYLPPDAVVEIHIRLPVKSLARFRCVCKDLSSLISSNEFITTHTNRALSRSDDNNNTTQVLFRNRNSFFLRPYENFSLRSGHGPVVRNNFIPLHFPLNSNYVFTNIVGLWNGLFCFAYVERPFAGYGYTLWNPSIQRVLRLPAPKFTSSSYLIHAHGFGYGPSRDDPSRNGPSSNDIKLVRLVYDEGHPDKVPPQFEIYTLKTGCWRSIAAPAPSYIVNEHCLSVFVNGASHWVAHTRPDEPTFRNVIVAFDMADEVFHEIAVPNGFVGKLYLNMTVAVCDGLLCLVPFNERMVEQSFSIWIMKEYGIGESWTELFKIHISQGLKRVVAFRQTGEVLVIDRCGELLSYEPNTQLVTQLGFHKFSSSGTSPGVLENWFYLDKYLESLVLLNA